MLCIREAIVVEGRYDKNTLSQVVDTLILETGGFQLFQDPERMALLDRAARRRGLVVLTDSDGAGFVIRNRIKGAIPAQFLKHAYIPDIYGKERRKRRPGKEGKLGVAQAALSGPPLTKGDLFAAGLAGGPGSGEKRQALLKRLELPEHMSANALLAVLNGCYSREEAEAFISG